MYMDVFLFSVLNDYLSRFTYDLVRRQNLKILEILILLNYLKF